MCVYLIIPHFRFFSSVLLKWQSILWCVNYRYMLTHCQNYFNFLLQTGPTILSTKNGENVIEVTIYRNTLKKSKSRPGQECILISVKNIINTKRMKVMKVGRVNVEDVDFKPVSYNTVA